MRPGPVDRRGNARLREGCLDIAWKKRALLRHTAMFLALEVFSLSSGKNKTVIGITLHNLAQIQLPRKLLTHTV